MKETTRNLREINKESQPDNSPHLANENTPNHQPIKNNEGVMYDVQLENTLNNMKKSIGFFNIEERDNGDFFWKGFPNEKIGGNKHKINENFYDLTPDFHEVITDTYNIPMKKLNIKERKIFNIILESLIFENYEAIRGESKSGR